MTNDALDALLRARREAIAAWRSGNRAARQEREAAQARAEFWRRVEATKRTAILPIRRQA